MRRFHYSLRWMLAVSMALVFAGLARSAGAEVKTFIQEYRYRAGQGDDKNAIRIIALRNVKRLLLEALGTYLKKETETRSDWKTTWASSCSTDRPRAGR